MEDELTAGLTSWLGQPTVREERRFLEGHPRLLDSGSEQILAALIARFSENKEVEEELSIRLRLLRDVRARGRSVSAIREAYVDRYGGFVLDLPEWLEEIEQQQDMLSEQPDQGMERVVLLRRALVRAQESSDVAPAALAELNNTLWIALQDTVAESNLQIQEEGMTCLLSALQVYTLARYPHQYALSQHNLGTAYTEWLAGDPQANIDRAIACYEAALHVHTPDTFPVNYAMTQHSLGTAFTQRRRADRQNDLEKAIRCYTAALRVCTYEDFPIEYATVQIGLGNAYTFYTSGEQAINLEKALGCFRAALRVFTREDFPVEYAGLQHNLGNLYASRIAGEKLDNLERAIACYKASLKIRVPESFPADYALTQHNLGNTYQKRIVGNQQANLEKAIACYKAALKVRTFATAPGDYAKTQHNLGSAYLKRIAGKRRNNLEKAISCYQEALKVYTHETFPIEYAMVQHNLGDAYQDRIVGDRRTNLERAITHYGAALHIYTRQAFPVDYALTQNNLGNAYQRRIAGERRSNFERAIVCYEAALQVYTRQAYPVKYAMVQNNLGAVYTQRLAGERQANLEQAIACYEAALGVATRDVFPADYAMTQHNLGNAYRYLTTGNRRVNLERAIACYEAALEVYTREAFPIAYAMAMHSLGNAYQVRMAGERQANLERAIACYEAALEVYTREAFPVDHALTLNNLGMAYQDRIAGERQANLERAITCYKRVLQVRRLDAYPYEHRLAQLYLAEAEMERGNWYEAHKAYKGALDAEEVLVALGAGVVGRDLVLQEGRDASTHDGFTLLRLGRVEDAAVTIERGRARGLAEALRLDAADPQQIADPKRRIRYQEARQAFMAAQAMLHASHTLDIPSGMLPADPQIRAAHIERSKREIELERIAGYHQTKEHFDMVVAEIRAAHDPTDFLQEAGNAATILESAQCGGTEHTLVYLAATPWGGMAVAAMAANPSLHTEAHFAALDLPALTSDLVDHLLELQLKDWDSSLIGGFAHAQVGDGFEAIQRDWEGTTFREKAEALHAACRAAHLSGALDAAAQEVLADPSVIRLVDQPLDELRVQDRSVLAKKVREVFLRRELESSLESLAEAALTPLAAWLQEQRVSSLTLITCGPLAAFPLAAMMVGELTTGKALPTSTAPSARSLLYNEHSEALRSGVYALGDPQKNLPWSEAEALTLAKLAREVGAPAFVRVQHQATRKWLIQALQRGLVVDASCHGRFDISIPLDSALLLAKGQRLQLGNLLSHEIDLRGLRLLILSACQTAILDLQGARDEVRSLAAGMLQAGARAVLATLWPVDDEATYLLMVRFAQEWFSKMDREAPAAALARTQQWLKTVTHSELQRWRATIFLPGEERQKADHEAVVHNVVLIGKEQSASAGVRGDRYDKAEAVQQVYGATRDSDPGFCPYADPVYWAGFQITGW